MNEIGFTSSKTELKLANLLSNCCFLKENKDKEQTRPTIQVMTDNV